MWDNFDRLSHGRAVPAPFPPNKGAAGIYMIYLTLEQPRLVPSTAVYGGVDPVKRGT